MDVRAGSVLTTENISGVEIVRTELEHRPIWGEGAGGDRGIQYIMNDAGVSTLSEMYTVMDLPNWTEG